VSRTLPPPNAAAAAALAAFEADIGETTLYRATGRFLAARGLDAPLELWGLVALTPTRLVFRHYPQAHPLFGGKTTEVRWEVGRDRFWTCEAVIQGFWAKLMSGFADHVALNGPEVLLAVETADDLRGLPRAWVDSARP